MLRPIILALALLAVLPARAETRLLMLEQPGCEWCELWNSEVGPVYGKTEEGRRAPLLRTNIHDPLPGDISLDRRASYTPTFVLIEDGAEVGRIEGYPGEEFFYGMLGRLFDKLDQKRREGGDTG